MMMRERGSIGLRHDCREFGIHLHLNSFTRCSRCGHSYDAVHIENEVCEWCIGGIDEQPAVRPVREHAAGEQDDP